MTKFNHRLRAATDGRDDDFFSDAAPVGKPTGVYVAFMEVDTSADSLTDFLGDDFFESAPVSEPAMFGGMGVRGTFVRFQPNNLTVDEVRTFVATLP